MDEPFWAYRHIEYCVEQRIVGGYEDGYYHAEIVVTRDRMAVCVARAVGSQEQFRNSGDRLADDLFGLLIRAWRSHFAVA